MTQDQVILLLLKVVLLADVASIAAFTGVYTRLAKWWRNPVGRTIVVMELLLLLAILPSMLSLFFQFNRLTSHIAAWVEIALFAAMAVTMAHRCLVFWRMHRSGDSSQEGAP